MKIVFTGAQGVGKTTLLDILEKCYTFKEPHIFVRNFTRELAAQGFIINGEANDATQRAILDKHLRIITEIPHFVMDRCIVDGFVHTLYLYRLSKVSQEVLDFGKQLMEQYVNSYDLVFYLVPEFPITGDKFRSSDVEYQAEIARLFEEVLQQYGLHPIKLTGTVGDRLCVLQNVLRSKGVLK